MPVDHDEWNSMSFRRSINATKPCSRPEGGEDLTPFALCTESLGPRGDVAAASLNPCSVWQLVGLCLMRTRCAPSASHSGKGSRRAPSGANRLGFGCPTRKLRPGSSADAFVFGCRSPRRFILNSNVCLKSGSPQDKPSKKVSCKLFRSPVPPRAISKIHEAWAFLQATSAFAQSANSSVAGVWSPKRIAFQKSPPLHSPRGARLLKGGYP